jgi:Predicted ATPase (AAA+ superfamily)
MEAVSESLAGRIAVLHLESLSTRELRESGRWGASSGRAGQIWENFVFAELIKNGDGVPGKNLYCYRDHAEVEVDFVLETAGGLCLIETKYVERIRSERLPFDRFAATTKLPILRKRVAAPSAQNLPLPMGDFEIYDPRVSS